MTEIQRMPKMRIKRYNAKEFFLFVKDKKERYELIDGRIYLMAAPSMDHQDIAGFIYRKLGNYLEDKPCKPFIAPLDVILFEKGEKDEKTDEKSRNVFQPDVFVVCDKDKMSQSGINGAPDFVAEVASPSSLTHDYHDKCGLYLKYGVKEYWIVNPTNKSILVYVNGSELEIYSYSFGDRVPVGIFENFGIDFSELRL